MISKSLQEYIKTMYILQKQTGKIRVTDVAEKLNCTKPSVNKALKHLRNVGLVKYEAYKKIELTKDGEELSKKLLEAYDIVYLFLKDVLNLQPDDAKIEAEKIKSSLNDNTINSLAKYVHKVLDMNDLDCGYDVNKEQCRSCLRRQK